MAQQALKASGITNRDATPAVLNDPANWHGVVKEAIGYLLIASDATGSGTPSSASTYRFVSIPSNARISKLSVSTDAVPGGGSATMDFGFYETTANGGAILNTDGDQIASAVDIHTAVLTDLDVTREEVEDQAFNLATQKVWQTIGASADTNKWYDIVGTLTASNTTGAIGMLVKVQYVL